MSPFLLLSLVFLLASAPCFAHHIIKINSSTVFQFSSIAWDPITQRFVVGSASSPTVYAIPEAGTIKCLLSEPSSNTSAVSTTAVAVDRIRQRLIVAFSNHSSVAAYDLKSYGRIFTVPLPELDGNPSGVAVDMESGDVFVSSAGRGVVLKVGTEGERRKVISEFKIPGDRGLSGLVHTSHGYIITMQPTTRRIFKVDSTNGTVEEVSTSELIKPLPSASHSIALQTDSSIAVATDQAVVSIFGADNSWEELDGTEKVKVGGRHGKRIVVAVATREGKTYALVKAPGWYVIEEVLWRKEYWDWIFLAVMLLCLAALYWFMWENTASGRDLNFTADGYYDAVGCEDLMCCLFRRGQNSNLTG